MANVTDYLNSECGRVEAINFIDAVRENRIFSISRKICANYEYIDFYIISARNFYPYCKNSFFAEMGFKIASSTRCVKVNGGNLDLSNHAVDAILYKLKEHGFDVPDSYPKINRL